MKRVLLLLSAMYMSLATFATVYLVETGSGNGTDCVWRAAGAGEEIVNLKEAGKSIDQWINGLSVKGSEVWLAGGTYELGATISPKTEITYIGGFSGKETAANQRMRVDLDGNGFIEPWEFKNLSLIDGKDKNLSFLSATNIPDLNIDGFVFQNLTRVATAASVVFSGGGTSGKMINSIVRNVNTSATGTIFSATINLNAPAFTLQYCLIEKNTASTTSNALYGTGLTLSGGLVSDCVIRANTNSSTGGNAQGGGVRMSGGVLRNSLIYNNISNGRGGGVCFYNPVVGTSVEYCTIVNNKDVQGGGGIYSVYQTNPAAVKNSIVMYNYKIDGTTLSNFAAGMSSGGSVSGITAANNCIYNGVEPIWKGVDCVQLTEKKENLTAYFNNPTAIDAATPAGDWTIKTDSVAKFQIGAEINAGELDFVGNVRPATAISVGAFEPNTFAFSAEAAENGTVTAANGSYFGMQAVAILATPNEGYSFLNWTDESGAVISTEAKTAYAMPLAASKLTANFKVSYVLTVSAGENGTVSSDKSGSYAPGSMIDLTATANNGYNFIAWKDATADTIVSNVPNFTYTMPAAAINLNAAFGKAYALSTVAGANGTITVNRSGDYLEGKSVSLIAVPVVGYKFKDWTDAAGTVISTKASFTYTTIAADVVLTANFYQPDPTIYLIETGKSGDKVWRTAGAGEMNVILGEVSLSAWIADNTLVFGDQLWLASGKYGITSTIKGALKVSYIGGFAGTETKLADRERTDIDENGIVEPWEFTNLSVIDASTIVDRKVARALEVKVAEATVDGLVVENAEITGYNSSGINSTGASVKILNTIIRNNRAISPDNNAVWGGGFAVAGGAIADGCLIENNYSEAGTANYAAGVDVVGTSIIRNSVIRGNESVSRGTNSYGGGGMRVIQSARAINCLVYNNTASNGSGVYLGSSGAGHTPSLEYCTIINNKTNTSGNGVSFNSGTLATVVNCVIMDNFDAEGKIIMNSADVNMIRNCIYNGDELALAIDSKQITDKVSDIFIAPTTFIGLPAEGASLTSRLQLKNGSAFMIGTEIDFDELDFLGTARQSPSFAGAFENVKTTLTLVAGQGGSISTGVSGDYFIGENIELEAVASVGNTFEKWVDAKGVTISTDAKFTYAMAEANTTLTAMFTVNTGINTPTFAGKIYANNGKLFVVAEEAAEVTVFSYSGQKLVISASAVSHELPLAKGAYIVVVNNGQEQTSTPIIIK